MLIRLCILALLILGGFSAIGQPFTCGTNTPPGSAALEADFLAAIQTQSITPCLNRTLSIKFILVTDSTEDPGVTPLQLTQAITNLNSWFAPICLSFQVCEIDTVISFKYDKWSQQREEEEFINLYSRLNVINIALVNTIEDPQPQGYTNTFGNSTPPAPRRDLLVIQKPNVTGKALPHVMGHFFGLYHTFETQMGAERVDGSNCRTAGDLLCDTPADVGGTPPVAPPCDWSGTNRDANNDLYTPIMGNIMSFHPETCPVSFTPEQYKKMAFSYLRYRTYLY